MKKKWNRKRTIKSQWLLLPSVLGILLFYFGPFCSMVWRSFCQNGEGAFCGLDNYIQLFQNGAFQQGAWNTLRFGVCAIFGTLFLSLFFAWGIYRLKKWGDLIQTMHLIPMVLPVTSVAMFWSLYWNKNGICNGIMTKVGRQAVDWLGDAYAIWALIFIFIWKNMGFILLLWLIGMRSVSASVVEAALMDGANGWNLFFRIILPQLRATADTALIFLLLRVGQIFREAYIMEGDYPPEGMYLMEHTFHNWFRNYDFARLSAGACVYAAVIVSITIFLRMSGGERTKKKGRKE